MVSALERDPGLYLPEAMCIEYGISLIYADGWVAHQRLWTMPITHAQFHLMMNESTYTVVDWVKYKAFFFTEPMSRTRGEVSDGDR